MEGEVRGAAKGRWVLSSLSPNTWQLFFFFVFL